MDNSENLIEVIKQDAIVYIKINTAFYAQLHNVATFLIADKSTEELKAAYQQIENDKVEDKWVQAYYTILILCNEFEKNAKLQEMTTLISKDEYEKSISNIDA